MISPHFPPDTSAGTHRVRLLAPHLRAFGWEPTVLTVDPRDYEGRLDPDLARLVPEDLEVVRCRAWSARATRRVGFGDLGLRSLKSLRRAADRLLGERAFDALLVTIYPAYTALLGPPLKRRWRIPFVLDYQDPWVGAWGKIVGGGRNGRVDFRSSLSRRLAGYWEPRTLAHADAVTAVSQRTIDEIVERNPGIGRIPHLELPIGGDPGDFDSLRHRPRRNPYFDPRDGNFHLCYVGTLLPLGFETLRAVLKAVARLQEIDRRAYQRLRLHFFGTGNQTSQDVPPRVAPVAEEIGVADRVEEIAPRIDYLDALTVQLQASALLLMGSSERHYTASKLYPSLLAERPLLAVYHSESTVCDVLAKSARPPTARLVTYDEVDRAECKVGELAEQLRQLIANPTYDPSAVDQSALDQYSARKLAGKLAGLFNTVAQARQEKSGAAK